ncbi:MAG: DUF1343 domain-containing protein [Chitinophagales bacterium]
MQISSSHLTSDFCKTFFFLLIITFSQCFRPAISCAQVIVGAERMDQYVDSLKGKKIALVVNQTSLVGKKHLADTLLDLGIQIKKIFAPEHGFRGDADAGENITGAVDSKTNIPIVSIYGQKLKPTTEDLAGIDLVIYDIQDVGVRFYTYVSTLHYVVEACAENNIPLLVLDRPDPNGYYVDGPVLRPEFSSFVGMDPVPVVYGMTPAEYAQMLTGEQWLATKKVCAFSYVLCEGYDHSTFYTLPVNPSPNLRSMNAIHLYPSICFFEGTPVSVGRGTDRPFSMIGYPGFTKGNAEFNPKSLPGAKNPPYLNQTCKGFDLTGLNTGYFKENPRLMLHWLSDFYTSYPEKDKFFTSFFDKLAGTDQLRKQIEKGTPEMEIRRSWEPALSEFKVLRKKYLLYRDFEGQ